MRMGIIAFGTILVIIGVVLLPVGEMVITESQHWYSGTYRSGQDKELLFIGELITGCGIALIIGGLITAIAGFVKKPKGTKVEKLQAKIKEKQLKDELKARKRGR